MMQEPLKSYFLKTSVDVTAENDNEIVNTYMFHGVVDR
jgi:hypothetical protein